MSVIKEFSAIIQSNSKGGNYVEVPFNVEEVFGSKRPKIEAHIDGQKYRGLLVRMGTPYHILLIRKDIREIIGKGTGDTVEISVQLDTAPRVVEVPEKLKKAMESEPTVLDFFNKLSYTHQKEYVNWITGAKREETRERRLNKAIEMMKQGIKGV